MDSLYKEVGQSYQNEFIKIISNGTRFFTLEGLNNGIYTDCLEVADNIGWELDKTSIVSFKPLYNEEEFIGYEILDK